MTKDILGKNIRRVLSPFEQEHMGKYFTFKGRVWQLVQVERRFKKGVCSCRITSECKASGKVSVNTLSCEEFLSRRYFSSLGKAIHALNPTRFEFNHCFFENNDIELVRALYALGYTNYGWGTSYSYHNTPTSCIRYGKLITSDETADEMREKQLYRELRLVDGKLSILKR